MDRPALRLRRRARRHHGAHGDLAHGDRREPRSLRRLALSGAGDDRPVPADHVRRRAALSRRRGARRRPRSPSGAPPISIPITRRCRTEIARLRARHARVVLYDCHSIRSVIPRLFDGELPVFNIGTNGGRELRSARSSDAVREIAAIARAARRVVNGRFKGGWITRAYGRPEAGVHALQMELACRGYMREPRRPGHRRNLADALRRRISPSRCKPR